MPTDRITDTEPLVIAAPELARPGGPGGGGPRDTEPGGGGGGGGSGGAADAEGKGKLAVQFAMASISALFIAIAAIYIIRYQSHRNWQPVPIPPFLWLSTAILLTSSAALEGARRALNQGKIETYGRWLVTTALLGLTFLVSQLLALRQLIAHGIYLPGNPHSSLFYVVTGLHGIHLMGGMLALFYLVLRAALPSRNAQAEMARQKSRTAVTAQYWHFLDALWIAIFALLVAVSG